MKRKAFVFLLAAVFAVSAGLISCQPNRKAVDIHNSRLTLDWTGMYKGVIPSASGSGIDVSLKLNIDDTYELTYKYIDKPEKSFTNTGAFKWDDTGEFVTLDITEAPSHYKVGENKLTQLDMNGKYITGKLADQYILSKE
jgi:uncharacterized lipoprotein NlpE involved in copper resistance